MPDGAGKKERAEESRLKAEATAAAKKAAEVDPFEAEQRARLRALADWESGKSGPIDVRNMPGSGVGMALFADAKKARDAGRVGRGLATLESGTNPAFATALDKEMGLERDLAASAGLDNYVQGKLAGLDERMLGLAGSASERAFRLAQMADSRFNNFLNRPAKPPSFLKSLALGGLQAGTQLATSFL